MEGMDGVWTCGPGQPLVMRKGSVFPRPPTSSADPRGVLEVYT